MPFKNRTILEKRAAFIQGAMNDPKWGAEQLRDMALGLESCTKTMNTVYALQDILFLSERTVFCDYLKD